MVMIEAATTCIDMDDARVGVGGLAVQCRASGDKLQIGIGGAAKTNQNPDRCEAIQIRGQVPDEGCRLHRTALTFQVFLAGYAFPPGPPSDMRRSRSRRPYPAGKYSRKRLGAQLECFK